MENISCFYVCNGARLCNLADLLNELRTIDDGAFTSHVSEEKNDFSNWIEGEIKDKVLARQISKTKDKTKIIQLIEKRLNSSVRRKKEIISQIKGAIVNE